MRKVLLLSLTVFLAVSICTVASAYEGDGRTGDQKNVVIRIDGDAAASGEEDWLFIGSEGDDEKDIERIKIKKERKSCAAYLGVYMDEISKRVRRKLDYPKRDGVLIIEVVDDSPAEEAGIEEDDIIYRFNGEEVEDAKHLSELVKNKKPGDTVEIALYRGGDRKEIDVVLGEYPYEISIDMDDFEEYVEEIGDFAGRLGKSIGTWWQVGPGGGGRLGMELTELEGDLAGYFDVEEDEGVLVLRVHEDSPAEEAGVKPGDVIVAFNGEDVSEVDDVVDEMEELEEGTVEIEVVRKGKKMKFDVEWEAGVFMHRMHPGGKHRIIMPQKHFDEFDKQELEKELEELKEELEELKKHIRELEKD